MKYSVQCKNIHFGHTAGGPEILSGVNLEIRSREIVGLSGRSGTGKSTLADILLGLLTPDSGQVKWNSRDRADLSQQEKRKERRYYQKIFQDPVASFPPHQTTGKALADLAVLYRLPVRGRDMIDRSLQYLGLGKEVLDRFPNQLSGGEMQRLALARVIMAQPRFVVADEPTSMLDISVQAEVVRLLEHLVVQNNWGLLFISHDEELIHAVCDRGLRLIGDGTGGASVVEVFDHGKQHEINHVSVTLHDGRQV